MTASAEHDFTVFYGETWGRTVACAYAMTGDLAAAEDIAQEAYARAWPRWTKLSSYDDPSAWVRQVAANLAVSRWRRSRVAARFLARNRRVETASPPDETSVALAEALRRIPEAQRRAIVLYHLADLSVGQVAEAEGCAVGTIKARLSRGRAALAVLLAPDDPPDPHTPADSNGAASHA